jgi:NAD(P)-dependent dehydrogenase (short-subunit alcohol dehydrogenase family)
MQRRTAVVTGSRRGIGAAIAEALLGAGLDVVVCGRDRDQVSAAIDRLHADGWEHARGFAGDLVLESERNRLVPEAGRVDVLVNNAGGFLRASETRDTTRSEWDDQLEANLTLPFMLCQAVLPGMLEREWGRIVNIGSVTAVAPQRGNAIGYVAAKAGLVGFTRQLAAEVAGTGVTANVVNPGTVATEHLEDYAEESGAALDDLGSSIPVGRLGRPREIGAIVPYLVSEDSAFMTGAVIDINGGAVSA